MECEGSEKVPLYTCEDPRECVIDQSALIHVMASFAQQLVLTVIINVLRRAE